MPHHNWAKAAEVILRVYPKHVGPLPESVEKVLLGALESPPKLNEKLMWAFKFAWRSAAAIEKVDDAEAAGDDSDFGAFHRRKRLEEMKRRIEAFRVEVERME